MDLFSALRLDETTSPCVISLTGGGGKTSTMYRLAAEYRSRDLRVLCTSTTRLAAYEVESTAGVVEVRDSKVPYDNIARTLDEHSQCLLVTPEIVEGGTQKYPGIPREMVDTLAGQSRSLGIDAIIVEADGAKMLPLKAPAEHEPPLPQSTTLMLAFTGVDAVGRQITDQAIHRPDRVSQVLGLPASAKLRVTPAHVATLLLSPDAGRKGCPPGARYLPILNKADRPVDRAVARVSARIMANQGVGSLIASTGRQEMEPVHERWGPAAVIILAAGASTRFGSPKQIAVVDGEPLVVRAAKQALDSGAGSVIVVTGAHADETVNCLNNVLHGASRLTVVHNSEWEQGQASSMHAGLAALAPETQTVVLMPVDQPRMNSTTLRRLIRRWQVGCDIAAPIVEGVVRGAPALFDRRMWPKLMDVRGDKGGRLLLKKSVDPSCTVDVDERVLLDIDAPGDLAQ